MGRKEEGNTCQTMWDGMALRKLGACITCNLPSYSTNSCFKTLSHLTLAV